jgi:hypothetical protein
MVAFTATIKRFNAKGGWTYIIIPSALAQRLKSGNKRSFRVKGLLDRFPVKALSLMPVGNGDFMLPINAALRKGTGKQQGDKLRVSFQLDKAPLRFDADLLLCLREEPAADAFFKKLSPSHRSYYSRWVASSRSEATKARRIARCIDALLRGQHYGEMLKWEKK